MITKTSNGINIWSQYKRVAGERPQFHRKLKEALQNGEMETARGLIESYPGLVNSFGFLGHTILGWAVAQGHEDAAKFLIRLCPELLHSPDRNGRTPLDIAIREDKKEMIGLLCKSGADIQSRNHDLRTHDLRTPLERAVMGNNVEKTELLLSCGADVNTTDFQGKTPMHHAIIIRHSDGGQDASDKNLQILEMLIGSGEDINAQDEKGSTPLHWAALTYQPQIVRLLLEKGADRTIVNSNGETPLKMAANPDYMPEDSYSEDRKQIIALLT